MSHWHRPFPQSIFYASTGPYNLGHTCNTWTAEGLQVSGLPVSAAGVVFASQVLDQVRPLLEPAHEHTQNAAQAARHRHRHLYRGLRAGTLSDHAPTGARWPVRKRQCPRQSLGDITVFTGSHNHGQGHETVFAQIVGDMLAVPRMWSEVIAATL